MNGLGFNVQLLDVFKLADHEKLFDESWDGLIWRAKHNPKIKNLAKKVIYYFNIERKIPTFPSWKSYSHYDDKIIQHYIFRNNNIITPNTVVIYTKADALMYIENSAFPIIYKSAYGAGSSNVGLLESERKASSYVRKVFGKGIQTFFKSEIQKGYVYFQEYIPNLKGDYRIVCYNDGTMTGFFRENSESAFASGSGNNKIVDLDTDLLKYVYEIHTKLGNEIVMSYDVLSTSTKYYLTEMSVLFGDLTSLIHSSSPFYKINNGDVIKIDLTGEDRHKRFIRLLLKTWGWLD
ncbi:MAG: hypothetical protein JW995_07050 [Melioribacteraceae bacterium]|nr:hypothetical protein [Melioribacteraceae bacterium]